MRLIAGNKSPKLEELCRAMPVSRDGFAESKRSQVLQQVIENKKIRLAVCPVFIAAGEGVWRKGRQSQQVIASVHDHVDGKVIARIDLEIRPQAVPEFQPFPFQL